MESVSTQELATAIRSQIRDLACLPSHINRICLDSRHLSPGDVFWALRGKNYDGHQFVQSAIENGAAACVVGKSTLDRQLDEKLLHVSDTMAALHQFAGWYRRRFSSVSIGITGSYGKSTTKEMLNAVLSVKQNGVRNQFNYNNEIGVPLTVLNLLSKHQYMIVEMGAAKPGDIFPLTAMAAPSIGIITGIGPAHLTGFKSIEEIVRTKGDLIASLPRDGLAVIAGDNQWTKEISKRSKCRLITFGFQRGNSFHAKHIESQNMEVRFQSDGCEYRIPTRGRHHVATALSVIAVAKELGYSRSDIQLGFDAFRPIAGRGQIVRQKPWTVIDDTYNANPGSCRAACEMLADWKTSGHRVLVMGDMLELGDDTHWHHEQLGQFAAMLRIDVIYTLGQQGESIARGTRSIANSTTDVVCFVDPEALIEKLNDNLRPDDVVLVKGSARDANGTNSTGNFPRFRCFLCIIEKLKPSGSGHGERNKSLENSTCRFCCLRLGLRGSGVAFDVSSASIKAMGQVISGSITPSAA